MEERPRSRKWHSCGLRPQRKREVQVMQTQTIENGQANKARQRGLVETIQDKGQIDRVAEFIRADIIDHSAVPGMPAGIEGVRMIFAAIRQGFPDHDAKIVQQIAEGDLVATYKTFT